MSLAKWFHSYHALLTQIAVILLIHAFLIIVVRLVGLRLIKKVAERAQPLREALYRANHSPVIACIVLSAVFLIVRRINEQIHAAVLSSGLDPALQVGILLVMAWACWNLVTIYPLIRRRHGHDVNPLIADLAEKFARFLLVMLFGLMILHTLNFSIASLLTFGGVAGIALGFAAQGVVSNVFGAMVVYMDQPFKVGEWIVLPELNISGTVEHIGWRSTKVRAFDSRPYYVPNNIFNTNVVQTPQRMRARRIDQTVPVRYCDADRLPVILRELRAFIHNHPRIDHSQSEMIYFTNYGPHSLDILIYCFVASVQWGESLAVQEDVLLNAARIIRRNGGELALPITRVQMLTVPSDPGSASEVASPVG